MMADCHTGHLSMTDGKMITTLLQLGGAYCTMCTKSVEECQKLETIEAGFMIERSVESLKELALSLMDPDTGDVMKKRSDYATRQGVCGQPLTEMDLTKNIPICHSKIRSFEFCMELLTRQNSHRKWSTATNSITFTKEEKTEAKLACEKIKQQM